MRLGLWGRGETRRDGDRGEGAGDGTKRLFEILPRFMGKPETGRRWPLSAMSHSWPAGLGLAGSLNSSEFVFRFCYFLAVFLLVIVFVLLRPFQNKYNSRIQNLSHKKC